MSDRLDAATRSPSATTRWRNASLVLVIVSAIVGITWLLGERNNYGNIGTGGINATLLPKVGELAPDLVTFDTEGRLVRLSDLRGQPVWLNFWGSWCPPCRAEFPDLQLAYEELQLQGLVMLGIAMREDPREAQDYADRMNGTFPILADPGYLSSIIPEEEYPEARALVTSYTVNNFPTHIFIDRDGTVRYLVLSTLDYGEAMAYGEAIIASAWPPSGGSPQT